MALTQGCLNIQFLLQDFLKPPVLVDPSSLSCIKNPNYKTDGRIIAFPKVLFYGVFFTVCFCLVFVILRVSWLIHYWHKNKDLEQLGFYVLLTAIAIIGLSAFEIYIHQQNRLCYVVNQRFKLLKTFPKGWPSQERKPDLDELLIYILNLSFLSVPVLYLAVPFIRDYDPIQVILRGVLQLSPIPLPLETIYFQWGLRITASITLGFLTLYGGGIVASVLMVILTYVEAMQVISHDLYEQPSNFSRKVSINSALRKIRFKFQVLKNWKSRPSTTLSETIFRARRIMPVSTRLKFASCLRRFHILYIMIRIGNKIVAKFLVVLASMGVLAAAWSGYTMIKLYHVLPFIVYFACSLLLPVCLFVDFFLIYLAAKPNKNGSRFRCFWKYHLKEKMKKMQLMSCSEIGYEIGPMRNIKGRHALAIADVILNCMATLVLMKISPRMMMNA